MSGKVVEFRKPDNEEEVEDTTIVEAIEMTDEMKQLFRENGYEVNDED